MPSAADPLYSFKSVTIPQRDDPRLEKLAKRCESCRPMGMFRSSNDEFLLCYDGMKNILISADLLLTVLMRRVWLVCRPPRRPQPVDRDDRVGRHSRACRLAPAIRAPLRLAFHRDPARRDRAARADHPGQRCALYLGRARGYGRAANAGRAGGVRAGDDLAGTARARGDEPCGRGGAARPEHTRGAANRAARLRAHPDDPVIPAWVARVAVAVDDILFAEQLAAALATVEPGAVVALVSGRVAVHAFSAISRACMRVRWTLELLQMAGVRATWIIYELRFFVIVSFASQCIRAFCRILV